MALEPLVAWPGLRISNRAFDAGGGIDARSPGSKITHSNYQLAIHKGKPYSPVIQVRQLPGEDGPLEE